MTSSKPVVNEDAPASVPDPVRSSPGKPDHADGIRVASLGFRILLVIVIVILASGVTTLLIKTKKTSERNVDPQPPLVVHAMSATPRSVDRVWEGFGTARTMIGSDIVAEVAGRVVARPTDIEPGTRVRSGDLLLQLDDTDYENAYEASKRAAEALQAQIDGLAIESERIGAQVGFANDEIDAALRDLRRTQEALDQNAGSQGEVDAKLQALRRLQREQLALKQQLELIPSRRGQLMAQIAGQRANERIARENRIRARITSPLDGEITRVDYRVGDWAGNGSIVARVVDLSRLEVPLKLPASSSTWVGVGDAVSLWIGDAEGEPAQVGKIVRVSPEADVSSRTITVYVEVTQEPGDAHRLLPGQFVLGRVRTADPDDRVVLPRRALQDGFVFVAAPSAVEGDNPGVMRLQRVAVRPAYGFDGLIPGLDEHETQWVTLEHGQEPDTGTMVVVTLLDQIEVGMAVVLTDTPDRADDATDTQMQTGTEGTP